MKIVMKSRCSRSRKDNEGVQNIAAMVALQPASDDNHYYVTTASETHENLYLSFIYINVYSHFYLLNNLWLKAIWRRNIDRKAKRLLWAFCLYVFLSNDNELRNMTLKGSNYSDDTHTYIDEHHRNQNKTKQQQEEKKT